MIDDRLSVWYSSSVVCWIYLVRSCYWRLSFVWKQGMEGSCLSFEIQLLVESCGLWCRVSGFSIFLTERIGWSMEIWVFLVGIGAYHHWCLLLGPRQGRQGWWLQHSGAPIAALSRIIDVTTYVVYSGTVSLFRGIAFNIAVNAMLFFMTEFWLDVTRCFFG